MVLGSMLTLLRVFAISVVAALAAVYAFFRWNYRHWSGRNIRTTSPVFPFGDVAPVGFSKNIAVVFKDIYDRFRGERLVGMWVAYRPYLMLRDPNLIRDIFIRDFNNFRDRGSYNNERIDPLTGNLFFIDGVRWRNLRTKLTPSFTSNKMRGMVNVMADKGERLRDELGKAAEGREIIHPKDYLVGYTHEVVAECLLGLQGDSIANRKSVFRQLGRKVFEPSWVTIVKTGLSLLLPQLAALLRVVATPRPATDFFLSAVREVMDFRDANAAFKSTHFMETLSQLTNVGRLENADRDETANPSPCSFTFENAAAQAFIFWLGAFETSATTMQFALFEMAKNREVQDKAREEVERVLERHNSRVTYDSLLEMEYLERVLEETLRKYPPVPVLNRVCTRTYPVPDSDVVVEKGTPILVPVLGIHMDPQYYPEPEKFDPERFTEENKSVRRGYTYLPFGEGPRACIGRRFAFTQMKIALASLLHVYKFEMTEKTPETAVCSRKMVLYSVRSGIPLRISRVRDADCSRP